MYHSRRLTHGIFDDDDNDDDHSKVFSTCPLTGIGFLCRTSVSWFLSTIFSSPSNRRKPKNLCRSFLLLSRYSGGTCSPRPSLNQIRERPARIQATRAMGMANFFFSGSDNAPEGILRCLNDWFSEWIYLSSSSLANWLFWGGAWPRASLFTGTNARDATSHEFTEVGLSAFDQATAVGRVAFVRSLNWEFFRLYQAHHIGLIVLDRRTGRPNKNRFESFQFLFELYR